MRAPWSVTRSRNVLVGLRTAVGGAALLAPRLTGRAFGIDPAANPASTYVGRLFGVRDLLMAHQLASATSEAETEEYLRGGILVDGVDTLAALAGGIRGDLSPRTAVMGGATAASAMALGFLARGTDDPVGEAEHAGPVARVGS